MGMGEALADDPRTDDALIDAYRAGDADALGVLVARYRRPLFAYILNMTGGQGDADEIFQEVWMRVLKHIGRYRSRTFYGWLVRIAHNLVIDAARRRRPDVSLDADAASDTPLEARLPGPGRHPGTALANRELAARIVQAVQTLPTDQREVFLLRTKAELPFKEIAAVQGTSINTVLARMHYAVRKLRAELLEEYAYKEAV